MSMFGYVTGLGIDHLHVCLHLASWFEHGGWNWPSSIAVEYIYIYIYIYCLLIGLPQSKWRLVGRRCHTVAATSREQQEGKVGASAGGHRGDRAGGHREDRAGGHHEDRGGLCSCIVHIWIDRSMGSSGSGRNRVPIRFIHHSICIILWLGIGHPHIYIYILCICYLVAWNWPSTYIYIYILCI